MAAEQINKERLDELLGIKEGQTFDEYLEEATALRNGDVDGGSGGGTDAVAEVASLVQAAKEKVGQIDTTLQSNIQTIESAKREIEESDGSASAKIDTLVNVDNAFKSIEDLVDTSKQMLVSVYGIISSCDVLDSETVSAAASLIDSTRQLIAEYTGLYKQRVKFFDNVKMEMLKQQHKLELLERKYQLDMEKYNQLNSKPIDAEDVTGKNGDVPPGMVGTSSVDMLKLLQEIDDEEEGENEEIVDEG